MKILMIVTLSLLCLTASAFSYDFQLPAVQDTFTDSFYLNTSYGDSTRLWAGLTVNYALNPPAIDGTKKTRSYLKFNLTGMENIDKAFLWLKRVEDDGWTYNDPGPWDVRVNLEPDNTWLETLTWSQSVNAGPVFDGDNTPGNLTSVGQEGWFSWNVTSFAKEAEGRYLSLVLTGNEPFSIFYSSEDGDTTNRPYLGINVVPEPATVSLLGLGLLGLIFKKNKRAPKKEDL